MTTMIIPANFRTAIRSPCRAITPSRRALPFRPVVMEEKVSEVLSMTS